jgi:hypothetical protein
MRGALKLGVPIAAGLGVGGYALSQGEDPGSAALATAAGGLGGAAGLLGARALTGKYAPSLLKAGKEGKVAAEKSLLESAVRMPEGSKRQNALIGLVDRSVGIPIPSEQQFTRGLGKAAAAGLVPAAALTAGLGGVALGAIPGAMGMPGFQQGAVRDPEAGGSSNTPSAQYGVTPYASTRYYA